MGNAGLPQPKDERERDGATVEFRPLLSLILTLALVAASLYIGLSLYWRQSQPTLRNPALLVVAARAYSRDLQAHNRPVPREVSMRDLINLGYLEAKDVQAFEGMEVTLMPGAPPDDPHSVLAHLRMPDGTQISVLGDGSVQQSRR